MKFDYSENKRYKRILNSINLDIYVGEFVGIIGCSGCGKSSLLNIVNNKIYTKTYSGQIMIEGQSIGPQIKKSVGYVMQEDILFPMDTPFETLKFVQCLKMQTYSSDIINKILSFVGLSHVKDSFIGSSGQSGMSQSFVKTGISGGERRRVSLARELVSGCKLLLCDEITSGLDLVTANNICSLIRKLTTIPYDYFDNQYSTNQPLTCVCTLHQPSSKVFSMLDRIIVMFDGQILYNGKPQQFYKDMSNICMVVPKQYNPADFLIEISVQSKNDFLLQQKLRYLVDTRLPETHVNFEYPDVVENQIANKIIQTVKKQEKNQNNQEDIQLYNQKQKDKNIKSQPTETYNTKLEQTKRFIPKPTINEYYNQKINKKRRNPLEQLYISIYEILNYRIKYKKNYMYQFLVLLKRFQKFHLRNPSIYIRFGCEYVILALFAGSLYWRLDRDFEGISTAVGSLLLIQMCCCFTPANEAALRYFNNRQAYLREHSSGLYGTSLYYLAQLLVDFPIYFTCCLIFSLITWFMIGFNDTFERWILSFIILLLLLYAILSMSIAFTYATNNYVNASVILMVILTILVVFAGPQINVDSIPDYYKWMPWISMFAYSYKALMYIYLDGQTVQCFSSTCVFTTTEQVYDYLGIGGYTLFSAVSYSVLFLACYTLVFYLIGYIGLRYKRFG